MRKSPLLGKNLVHDVNPTYRSRDSVHRFRLTASLPDTPGYTASLPDTPGYAYGSSVSETNPLAVIFPVSIMASLPVSSNQLPRSWYNRGAPSTWTRSSLRNGDIAIKSTMKSRTANDLGTL